MDTNIIKKLDVRVLGQLLLMQSVMVSLPDDAIRPFVIEGLADTRLIHSNNLFFQIQKDNPLQWTNATI